MLVLHRRIVPPERFLSDCPGERSQHHYEQPTLGSFKRQQKEKKKIVFENRTTNAKFMWRSLAGFSYPNEFAIGTETSRPTAQSQACQSRMGKTATFKMKVFGRIASTAKT